MWRPDIQHLFPLPSQTSEADRYFLTQLFTHIRDRFPGYRYTEIGSYLGGTLTPALLDERCGAVLSIDSRPAVQPDTRNARYDYSRVSTATMLEVLRNQPGLDLGKLATFDGQSQSCGFEGARSEFVFIDAEHTDEAVFSDFLAVYPHIAEGGVCAFHDSNTIVSGLENALAFVRFQGRQFTFLAFDGTSVSAVFLDTAEEGVPAALLDRAADWNRYKEAGRDHLLTEAIRHRCVAEIEARQPEDRGMVEELRKRCVIKLGLREKPVFQM